MKTISEALEAQAIKAAYPLGGHALGFQRPVIDALVERGMVEIANVDEDGGVGYNLTHAGKALYHKLEGEEV